MSNPITRREYEARTKKEWKGTRVRTVVPIENRLGRIPRGTLCTIMDKAGGFTLETDPCPHCGVQFFIRKVHPKDVSYEEVGL